jgi:hypothetical protein
VLGSDISLVRFWEKIVRRREFIALLGAATAIRSFDARAERPPDRVLYFTYSAGYRHEVIPLSKATLTQLESPVFSKLLPRKTRLTFRPKT